MKDRPDREVMAEYFLIDLIYAVELFAEVRHDGNPAKLEILVVANG